jgi:glutathionylspermidine synthase
MYNRLSDKLLFDYFMLHSTRKEDIYCTVPFYLSEEEYKQFRESSEVINKLVFKIMTNITTEFKDFQEYMPSFKYKEEIINLKRPMDSVFWVRYDGFLRADGGVFYSEFNYDKPCAEREILATGDMKVHKNINTDYRIKLKTAFKGLLERQPVKERYRIALLSDPCHYEETNLMFLLMKELSLQSVEFVLVGPKNLNVIENTVYAFEKPVDIIIRLFPTEFSHEINHFDKILEAFENYKVDIVNDPRVIIGQCKSLYTYLWMLIEAKDSRVTEEEAKAVRASLPYTEEFNQSKIEEALKHKDRLVLKPVYGRYSIDVFIGTLLSDKEWIESIKYALESEKSFILQEFCKIKSSEAYYTLDGNFVFPTKAFGNVGCFMLHHELSGSCVRWSTDYLTTDEYTWITPIGIKSDDININKLQYSEETRKALWNKVTERAMFEADFTGRYARRIQYIGLEYISLSKKKYLELVEASEKLAEIMHRTQNVLFENLDYFADILGIIDLKDIIRHRHTEEFLFLGRMDWALDCSGELKLLEINSETPAGLAESLFVDSIIAEELRVDLEQSNKVLKEKIVSQFSRIINDYSRSNPIKTIGLLSSTYYEDWYTVNSLYKILRDLPYDFIVGSIYDCKVSSAGKWSLHGKELDAIYRYYPLDWFDKEDMKDKKEALKNTLSINPPHTIVSQSKAFFAVMYELLKQGFYEAAEKEAIIKYIPKTSFDVKELETFDYIVKPILSREGDGVVLACELKEQPDENHVYQERVNTLGLDYGVYDSFGRTEEVLYPILGVYIAGTSYGGMYARLGEFVTSNSCIYTPVFVKEI